MNFNIDEQGYLVDADSWDEDVARAIAQNEGIDRLTDEMMDVIRFMRSYYRSYTIPHPQLGLQECAPTEGMRQRGVHRSAESMENRRTSGPG